MYHMKAKLMVKLEFTTSHVNLKYLDGRAPNPEKLESLRRIAINVVSKDFLKGSDWPSEGMGPHWNAHNLGFLKLHLAIWSSKCAPYN